MTWKHGDGNQRVQNQDYFFCPSQTSQALSLHLSAQFSCFLYLHMGFLLLQNLPLVLFLVCYGADPHSTITLISKTYHYLTRVSVYQFQFLREGLSDQLTQLDTLGSSATPLLPDTIRWEMVMWGYMMEAHSIGSIYKSGGHQTYFIQGYTVNSLGFAGLCCNY